MRPGDGESGRGGRVEDRTYVRKCVFFCHIDRYMSDVPLFFCLYIRETKIGNILTVV